MAEDGMHPPPARPQTNADFRKLLDTPRVDRSGDVPRERKSRKQADAPRPKKKSTRPKPEPEKPAEDGYRDRAEERRKGFNPDYERVSADLASLVGGGRRIGIDGDPSDPNQLSMEEKSKYLGGDMDHTHLVKGLDYALLQKIKGEMGKDDSSQAANGKSSKAAPPSKEPEVVKFKGPVGRAVYNAVFPRTTRVDTSQLFLQGHTAFVYDLETPNSSDIPTTLRRSKADCPEVVETISGGMDKSVLERMVKIMSYMRGTGSKPGKLKKKEKQRIQQMARNKRRMQMMDGLDDSSSARARAHEDGGPMQPVDEDADIFGDAGRDYQPELPQFTNGRASHGNDMDEGEIPPPPPPPPSSSVGPARPSGGYNAAAAAYAAYGDAEEEPPPPPPPPPGAPPLPHQDDAEDMELDQLAGFVAPPPALATEEEVQAVNRAMRRKADANVADEIIPRDTEDAYEELYPGYGGFSGAVVDSDDEDLTHMDGVREAGRSRKDFETQEQWEAYKSNKEMNPKAAYQFGVKTKDGRKGQGKLGSGGGRAVEQKEQQQLKKIQGIFDEKHGDKYSKAFAADPEPAGAGPSRTPAPKRRRI